MKQKIPSFILLLLAITLSACGGEVASSTEVTMSEIYTAVAMTLAGQAGASVPTNTPSIVSTPEKLSTPTQFLIASTYATPTTTYTYSSAVGCDNSAYVSDVTIPDGTVLAPDETFTKTWEFLNNGGCTWSADYSITFVSGTGMDGETTLIDQTVSSGSTAEISVALAAPASEGTYTGYWQLADEDGTAFGQSVFVQIVVSDDAATLTPTATSESTGTSTQTLTPTSTFTPVPTETPTFNPTETLSA